MSNFLHSIRWRIQVWHGLILFGAIAAFCLTTYHFAWDQQLRRIDRDLQQTERSLIRVVMQRSDSTSQRPLSMTPEQIVELLRTKTVTLPTEVADLFKEKAYYSLRDYDGTILLQSANAPADLVLLPAPASGFNELMQTIGDRRESLRSSAQGLCSLVGRNLEQEHAEMHRFGWLLGFSGLVVWLAGLIGGWWFAGRAIRPIDAISKTASRIAEGNLTERINTTGNDSELDQLSHVLNQTFERLHQSFERQTQFTSDASHELRTPVAILLSETQRALKRERSAEEYRAVIATCHTAAERMHHLIAALLLLARRDGPTGSSTKEPCDLANVLGETINSLRPIASTSRIELETDLQPALCLADTAAISILASNLIRNAIQHQASEADGGKVRIGCGRENGRVFFIVSDNGPGIPEADLPHIFQRFYRADKARSSKSGHTGLGLAIAQTIAENHGGTIEARNLRDRGAAFTVRFPAGR